MVEKRLLHDCSIQNMQPKMHNLIDFQSCYDRQLVNVYGVVEEAVGAEKWVIKLFSKVTQLF